MHLRSLPLIIFLNNVADRENKSIDSSETLRLSTLDIDHLQ